MSWGGPDFAFRNSRDYPIKIVTSYNDDTNELTCTILGTKVDDHYVVMTNAVLASYDYQTVYQESPDVAPGEEVIDQYGHTGYFVRTWRNREGAVRLAAPSFHRISCDFFKCFRRTP